MSTELKLPGLGADDAVVTLLKWHVKPGDTVSAGDLLAELESDKTVVEFEADTGGTIAELRVEEGNESVRAGDVLAVLGQAEGALAAADAPTPAPVESKEPAPVVEATPVVAAPPATESEPSPPVVTAASDEGTGATALAAAIARQTETSLDDFSGTGAAGRITARDVGVDTPPAKAGGTAPASLSPLAARMLDMTGQSATSFTHTGADERLMARDIGIAFGPDSERVSQRQTRSETGTTEVDASDLEAISAPFTDEPASAVRKATARRLSQSKREAPHYYMSMDMCVDALIDWRTTLNQTRADEARISINDIMIKMVAGALKQTPELNALWTGDAIRQFERVDLAVAVASERGLITPVLRGAEQMNVDQIHANVAELVAAASAGKLKTTDMTGGTFTISNLGMFGVREFSAIINPPQAAILAIAGTRVVAVPVDANPDSGTTNRSMMTCTLSVDHRAADGVDGARFLNVLKNIVEDPRRLLL